MHNYDVRGLAAERQNQLIAEARARRTSGLVRATRLPRAGPQPAVRAPRTASRLRVRDRLRTAVNRRDSALSAERPSPIDTSDLETRSTEQLEDTRV
jgi:hypothetical protein